MDKIVSFSLFGPAPIYQIGMIRNAMLAKEHFAGWKVVCYCDRDVPQQLKETLKRHRVEVREPDLDIVNQVFWRFLVADDLDCERFLIRDCDSRLGPRERSAVDAWIASDLDFHIMGDHPYHWVPMGAGMWGAKGDAIKGIKKLILDSDLVKEPHNHAKNYNVDQVFLTRHVLPLTKGKLLRHDSCNRDIYPEAKPFPSGCCFGCNRFVGEVFDAEDKPNPCHWQLRVNYQTP